MAKILNFLINNECLFEKSQKFLARFMYRVKKKLNSIFDLYFYLIKGINHAVFLLFLIKYYLWICVIYLFLICKLSNRNMFLVILE